MNTCIHRQNYRYIDMSIHMYVYYISICMNLLPWFTADGHVFFWMCSFVVSCRFSSCGQTPRLSDHRHCEAHIHRGWPGVTGMVSLSSWSSREQNMGTKHGKILGTLWPMFPPRWFEPLTSAESELGVSDDSAGKNHIFAGCRS